MTTACFCFSLEETVEPFKVTQVSDFDTDRKPVCERVNNNIISRTVSELSATYRSVLVQNTLLTRGLYLTPSFGG